VWRERRRGREEDEEEEEEAILRATSLALLTRSLAVSLNVFAVSRRGPRVLEEERRRLEGLSLSSLRTEQGSGY